MRKFAFAAIITMAAVFFVCSGNSASAQAQENNQELKQVLVTVQKNDSLSKLATKYSSTYQRIYFANPTIKDPDLIYPGETIRVPGPDEVLTERPLTTVVVPSQKTEATATPQVQKNIAPKSVVQPNYSVGNTVWDRLANCESGGKWAINTGNGYYGGLQFSLSSWRGVGGTGFPHQASRSEQISRGEILLAKQGWGAWPACSAKLGLR